MRCLSFTTVVLLAVSAGCSGGSDADSVAKQASAGNRPEASLHPAARVAKEFLIAVLDGDTATASSRLTPRAIEQFQSTGKRFAPPGFESASFHVGVGEVHEPSKDQAIIQCLLTNPEAEGESPTEKVCCMMRRVGTEWRVGGIAYDAGGPQLHIEDFENIDSDRPASPRQVVEQQGSPSTAPRTAERPTQNFTR